MRWPGAEGVLVSSVSSRGGQAPALRAKATLQSGDRPPRYGLRRLLSQGTGGGQAPALRAKAAPRQRPVPYH